MDAATGKKAIDYFLSHMDRARRSVISFYGGEPFTDYELMLDLISYTRMNCADADPLFTVSTNGYILGENVCDEVLSSLVDWGVHFQLSLDGSAEDHDRHRRTVVGDPTHEAVTKAIDRILDRDPTYFRNLSYSLTVGPGTSLKSVSEYFRSFSPYRKHGIQCEPDISVSLADLRGTGLNDGSEYDEWRKEYECELEDLQLEYIEKCIAGKRNSVGPVEKYLFDQQMRMLYRRVRSEVTSSFVFGGCCVPGVQKLYVTADGRYQACERICDDVDIGNIDTGVELDKVQIMHESFIGLFDAQCDSCWAMRFCKPCYTVLGGGGGVPSVFCNSTKKLLDRSLRSYVRLMDSGSETPDFLLVEELAD
jgi:uncharacterized protein